MSINNVNSGVNETLANSGVRSFLLRQEYCLHRLYLVNLGGLLLVLSVPLLRIIICKRCYSGIGQYIKIPH
jgi:hypothetical protein